MYFIDHVAELRFVNRLIYAIKRIYTPSDLLVFGAWWLIGRFVSSNPDMANT